ncbi:MAG TPA: hypothetical protein VKV27_14545 [Solirubrobacteraceae bacterium]|nr:hypothetical protein [Solirubrobacteraceae bacterium]
MRRRGRTRDGLERRPPPVLEAEFEWVDAAQAQEAQQPSLTPQAPVGPQQPPVGQQQPPAAVAEHPPAAPQFGELLAAGCSIALLVCMLSMAWYGVAGVPDPSYARPAVATTVDGWNGLPAVRWVIVATVLASVGSLALRRAPRGRAGASSGAGDGRAWAAARLRGRSGGTRLRGSGARLRGSGARLRGRGGGARLVPALGCLTSALLVWRVLVELPGGGRVLDQKLGALVGLACALGIAWGGAEMAMRRGVAHRPPAQTREDDPTSGAECR